MKCGVYSFFVGSDTGACGVSEVLDSAAGFWRIVRRGYQTMWEVKACMIRVGAYVSELRQISKTGPARVQRSSTVQLRVGTLSEQVLLYCGSLASK